MLPDLAGGIPGRYAAGTILQMPCWLLAFTVPRAAIERCRRGWAYPSHFIPNIGPKTSGFGLARAGRQHHHWRAVCENRLSRQHMASDRRGQQFQQGGGLSDPTGEGLAFEIDAFALEDLALPIQRQVVCVFAHKHMRELPRLRTTLLGRALRKGRLADRLPV